jgi:PKHD-type hydroxylase
MALLKLCVFILYSSFSIGSVNYSKFLSIKIKDTTRMDWKMVFPQKEIDLLNWYWFERGFSIDEINRTHALAEHFRYEDAITLGTATPTDEIRKSRIKWISNSHNEARWLYTKMLDFAKTANANLWNFDLISSPESIQYTEYREGGGHYGYHLDIGQGSASHRKVSLIVQLSDPSEYDGGDFEILRGMNPEKLPNTQGAVILFPSYMLHRVTPVTRGIRRSLVLWVGGSAFR